MGLDLPRPSAIAAALEDELRLHLDLRTDQLIRQGLSRDDARRIALQRYGEIDATKREIHRFAIRRGRRMKLAHWLDGVSQDARFAARSLGRHKGWTLVAVLTLSLGIGANTAVFSVVNDLIINPMRYPQPERLVLVSRVNPQSGFQISPTRRLHEEFMKAKSLEAIEGVATNERTLFGQGDPQTVQTTHISASFPGFAGAHIVAGRGFTAAETTFGGPPVVLLSEHMWRRQFGTSADALGMSINIDGRLLTVVGVMADGVRLPSYGVVPTDFWLPLTPAERAYAGSLVARLGPGMNTVAVQQELQSITDAVALEENWATKFEIRVRKPGSIGQTRQSLLLLYGAVSLLLLIACANVAHLLITRGAARQRELAIRSALGAGGGRIMSLLVTESLLLAAAGAAAAMLLGAAGLKLLVMFRPDRLSELVNARIDGRVLGVTLLLALATGVIFGLVAGFHSLRGTIGGLRSASGVAGHGRSQRLRSTLVVTEMALSAVLIVSATLLARTVANLYDIDPGFDTTNLSATTFTLPDTRYATEELKAEFSRRLRERAQRIPGVESFTLADNVPTRSSVVVGSWIAEGRQEPNDGSDGGFTAANTVRGEYFDVMGMRFLTGRSFDDGSRRRNEVVVSESLARMLWGETNVVGRRFRTSGEAPGPDGAFHWNTVIGVVGNASMLSLREERVTPAMYFPTETGAGYSGTTLIVRARPGQSVAQSIRAASLELDPQLPPPPTQLMADLLQRTVSMQRFLTSLLSLFAGLAVVLSAIGLYGVIAYNVSQRVREIGIRVALGAQRGQIAWLVMRHGVILTVVGLTMGCAGAIAATRLIQSMLYQVSPMDVPSFAVGVLILLVIAAVAGLAPTIRALGVDPAVAMRAD